MITFCVLCIIAAAIAGVLLATLVVGSGILAGVGLVLAYVCVDVLPFVGLFMLFKWLFTKKEEKEEK